MNILFPSARTLIFFLFAFCLYGCIKTTPETSPPVDIGTPTVTPVGTPLGDAVTKTIGASGGSLSSEDGNIELIFPSGALSSNTDISIQPVTNTAPNGFGHAYSLLPNGIHFLQPVTLKFHYTAGDLASTLGDLMGIAFQDSIGGWWRVTSFTNDTVNKIISAPIKHFSVWTPFDMLLITPSGTIISVDKHVSLEVIVMESDDPAPLDGSDDVAAPIVRSSNTKPIVWAANGVQNGNSTSGTLAGTSFYGADFHAPSKVPSQNPVNISATIDVNYTYHGKKIGKASLISNIRIVDAEEYLFEARIVDTVVDTDPDYIIVWDSVSMKITIKDDIVTVSEITNFEPRANPSQIVYPDDATHYVPDPIGEINVVSGKGVVAPYIIGDPSEGRLLALTLTHSGTHDPKTHYTTIQGYSDFSGGDPNNGYPTSWGFQILPDGSTDKGSDDLVGILTKVIDVKLTLIKN